MIEAVLDACVLYPVSVADVFLSVANEGVFRPYWSLAIHDEWERNLLKNRPDLEQKIVKERSATMDKFFPNSCVNDFHDCLDGLMLPDADDNHVLALAIKTKSKYIVTFNLSDFPQEDLKKHGVQAIHPDRFLIDLLHNYEELVIEGMKSQRKRLKNPPYTAIEFIEKLTQVNLSEFAKKLESFENSL